jgi:ParB-like chromosome segregation protein Spo0J
LTKLLTIALDKLVALRRNPQYLTEAQMEGLKTSIERDGFLAPIVVRKRPKGTFEILSGNHRVMACRELGHTDIACVLINPCTDAQAARIAMNMNTVHGDPNVELIAPFLSTLDDRTLKEIYLPDLMLAEIKTFDATLKERLAGLQVPDALDNTSNRNSIPNCVCKCGHRHVARTS